MAYLKELRVPCNERYCAKQAVVQAFDNRNEGAGLYCRKHGIATLQRLRLEHS